MGHLRNLAKEIKKDHDLAIELWSSGKYFARQLALLIMDKKLLSQDVIDRLDKDISQQSGSRKASVSGLADGQSAG